MKKYLLQVCSFDELFYRGFECDDSKTFLQSKLKRLVKNTPKHRTFVFFGHEIDKASYYQYKIITLDEFWKNSLKKS